MFPQGVLGLRLREFRIRNPSLSSGVMRIREELRRNPPIRCKTCKFAASVSDSLKTFEKFKELCRTIWSDSRAWGWKCSIISFSELFGLSGLEQKIIENYFFGAMWNDSRAWSWKYMKTSMSELAGAIFWLGAKHASFFLHYLEHFSGLELKPLENEFFGAENELRRAIWSDFLAWNWKCSKRVSRSWSISKLGATHAERLTFRSYLERFSGLELNMMGHDFFGTTRNDPRAWSEMDRKWACRSYPERFSGLGLNMLDNNLSKLSGAAFGPGAASARTWTCRT